MKQDNCPGSHKHGSKPEENAGATAANKSTTTVLDFSDPPFLSRSDMINIIQRSVDILADVQTEKTPKGVPVENLKFGRVVRQVVQRLQNENFEQQDDIVPLRTNSGLLVFVPSLFEFRAEHLPLNRLIDLGKRIAILVDFVHRSCRSKKPG